MPSHDPEQNPKKPQHPTKAAGGGGSHVPMQTTYVYEFGDFRLDPEGAPNYRLLRNGQPYKIQDKPFQLLRALVENHGRELTNEELIRLLWPDEAEAAAANAPAYVMRLHTHMRNLRKDVGKDLIKNRKGGGYYLNSPVKKSPRRHIPMPPPADLDFEQWIVRSPESRGIKLFLFAGVALSLLYALASAFYRQPFGLELSTGFSVIQLAVITGALIASVSVFDRNVKEFPSEPEADAELMRISGYAEWDKWVRAKAGAVSSLKRFSRYWKLLLVAWFCLYLLLTLSTGGADVPAAPGEPSVSPRLRSVALTVFNNCNSWVLALCFIVLNHPTVVRRKRQGAGGAAPGDDYAADEGGAGDGADTSLTRLTRRIKVVGLLAVTLFAAAECVFVFTEVPRRLGLSSGHEAFLSTADSLSGIIGAITLALFIGRIQSKFLGTSAWVPLAFFFYAAIQSLYPVIKEDSHWAEDWGPTMIEAALILKCLLYLYVAWLFKSGRLLFYLVKVRTVYERVNIDWHDFLGNLNR